MTPKLPESLKLEHGLADLGAAQLQEFAVDHVDLGAFNIESDLESLFHAEGRSSLRKKCLQATGELIRGVAADEWIE